MSVERIFTRAKSGGPSIERRSVQIVAGKGITGDRYYERDDEPGQNVTFIEVEELESFFAEQQRDVDASLSGRNVVTRGVRLNALVGREFVVGDLRFRGIELCEPCRILGAAMASTSMPAKQVVRRMAHRAGLRASALTSGEIVVGAQFRTPAATF